jgi:hypothetical protein
MHALYNIKDHFGVALERKKKYPSMNMDVDHKSWVFLEWDFLKCKKWGYQPLVHYIAHLAVVISKSDV